MEVNNDSIKRGNSPCYFCNELFEMGKLQNYFDTILPDDKIKAMLKHTAYGSKCKQRVYDVQNHLKECGSILEQCPLRCGAWIQRKHRDGHSQECPTVQKSRDKSSPTYARLSDPEPPTTKNHTWKAKPAFDFEECIQYLEKEVSNIKLVLTEESGVLEVHSTDLETIRSRLVLVEERSQHFLSTLVSLRAAVDDEAERSANWAAQFKHDLSNVQLAMQELQSQQLSTVLRLESAVSSIVHEQNERELLEQALTHHDTRIRTVNQLEEVIEYIKRTVEEEKERNAANRAALEAELVEARRSSEQLSQLSALRVQLQSTATERQDIDRLAVLEVATADARAEAAEQASKMDVLTKHYRALVKSYHKIQSSLVDIQSKASFEHFDAIGSDNGHFIWRIDNFSARMKDAKEHETVLSSPLFRTSRYGYTLKAEVSLNGLGKWKGRHITCTVRLVKGAYDTLLEWPCDIDINIALKDQPAKRSQAMDLVKSLQLRRKPAPNDYDDDKSADERSRSTETLDNIDKTIPQHRRQHIYIPHATLEKLEYVKNDVMFLEFIVNH